MKVKVFHHVFGKTPERDFSTLICTTDLEKSELRTLEQFSHYRLLPSLMDENKPKPKKYVYYKLNEEKIVIGRGIDLGKDEFNRWGNFLFHNLIFDVKEFCKAKVSPPEMINYLENNNIFLSDSTGNLSNLSLISHLNIEQTKIASSIIGQFRIDKEPLPYLVSICLNNVNKDLLCWVHGDIKATIKFLEFIFAILPVSRWINISFNTFWNYNEEKLPGIYFVCTSEENAEGGPSSYVMKIDLYNKNFETGRDIYQFQPVNYEKFFAEMVVHKEEKVIKLFNQLYEMVIFSNWRTFTRLFIQLLDEKKEKEILLFGKLSRKNQINEILYEYWHDDIISEISNGNIELFKAVRDFLSYDDIQKIFTSGNFIIELSDVYSDIQDEFINWFFTKSMDKNKTSCYRYILDNPSLYKKFVDKLYSLPVSETYSIFIETLQHHFRREQIDKNKIIDLFLVLNKKLDTSEKIPNKEYLLRFLNEIVFRDKLIELIKATLKYKLGEPKELINFLKEDENVKFFSDIMFKGLEEIIREERASRSSIKI
ncbi:MAG: hypothetical protein N2490_03230 [Ignavibacteria bacterium]|nr:hypothetical protein [Ignavibacteria bacterium]